jgi:hypothetical protein
MTEMGDIKTGLGHPAGSQAMASPAFKNLMMILLAGERLHVRLPLKILGRLAAAGNFVLLTGHKLRLQIEAEVG